MSREEWEIRDPGVDVQGAPRAGLQSARSPRSASSGTSWLSSASRRAGIVTAGATPPLIQARACARSAGGYARLCQRSGNRYSETLLANDLLKRATYRFRLSVNDIQDKVTLEASAHL